jgi:hypothetical protein
LTAERVRVGSALDATSCTEMRGDAVAACLKALRGGSCDPSECFDERLCISR